MVKNLLYRLTPFDAYRQGMVKKIEVLSVAEKNDEATLKLELIEVEAKGANLTHGYLFTATAVSPVFAGYLKVYNLKDVEQIDQEKDDEEDGIKRLPDVTAGDACNLEELKRKQNFTEQDLFRIRKYAYRKYPSMRRRRVSLL